MEDRKVSGINLHPVSGLEWQTGREDANRLLDESARSHRRGPALDFRILL